MRLRNVETGDVVEMMDRKGERTMRAEPGQWEIVVPDAIDFDEPFDPSKHTVGSVNTYLSRADPEERHRVIVAELDGKARSSIRYDLDPAV